MYAPPQPPSSSNAVEEEEPLFLEAHSQVIQCMQNNHSSASPIRKSMCKKFLKVRPLLGVLKIVH